jgi:predicted CopG family antitoxin
MPATEPIRIGKDTKEELKKLKVHPRETYDDVIKRLFTDGVQKKSARNSSAYLRNQFLDYWHQFRTIGDCEK